MFKASVQYNDKEGTSAADMDDNNYLNNYIKEKDLNPDDDFLIGIDIDYTMNMFPSADKNVTVNLLFVPIKGFDELDFYLENKNDIEVFKKSIDMSIDEFFMIFKRLNIKLSPNRKLDNKKIIEI
jgi:hypothetical protein